MKSWVVERWALLMGGLASILASTCCLGPLLLVLLGFSGSWLSNLTLLEPYKPVFIAIALVAMAIAWKKIYRPVCREGEVCSRKNVNLTYKVLFWLTAVLLTIALISPYVLPFFYD